MRARHHERSLRLAAAVGVLAVTGLPLLGEAPSVPRRAPAEDVIVEEDPDPEERPGVEGVVFLSSGERIRGRVRLTAGRSLHVHDVNARRNHVLDLERIVAIRTVVESEKIEEAWTFEEGGSRKKVRLGWSYPVRAYRQEVQLAGGEVLEVHCQAAVLWIDDGSTERKVILPRSQKGERGQRLEDLVYPASIDLGGGTARTAVGKPARGELASLAGTMPGLTAIALVEIATARSQPGSVSSGGEYRADGLLPGDYAAFLQKGREVVHGLEPIELDAGRLDAIRKRIEGLAEFFDSRRIAAVSGAPDAPWLLVELERAGGTTLTSDDGRSWAFRRWELWALERRGEEWVVEGRAFLFRTAFPPGEAPPPPTYRREPALGRIALRGGKSTLP